MNYWVIKARLENRNPNDHPLGEIEDWSMGIVNTEAAIGDRLFIWQAGPGDRGIVQLGEIDNRGHDNFQADILTPSLNRVRIRDIDFIPVLKGAEFLIGGPRKTFYPVSPSQAVELYKLVVQKNPNVSKTWPDLLSNEPERRAEDATNEIDEGIAHRKPSTVDEYKRALSYVLDTTSRNVNPAHHNYQVRLERFLRGKTIVELVERERDFVDISFRIGSEYFIGEIKVTSPWLLPIPAFRMALGQLFDYADEDARSPQKLMLLDKKPNQRRLDLASRHSIAVIVWDGVTYRLLNPEVAPMLKSVFDGAPVQGTDL